MAHRVEGASGVGEVDGRSQWRDRVVAHLGVIGAGAQELGCVRGRAAAPGGGVGVLRGLEAQGALVELLSRAGGFVIEKGNLPACGVANVHFEGRCGRAWEAVNLDAGAYDMYSEYCVREHGQGRFEVRMLRSEAPRRWVSRCTVAWKGCGSRPTVQGVVRYAVCENMQFFSMVLSASERT